MPLPVWGDHDQDAMARGTTGSLAAHAQTSQSDLGEFLCLSHLLDQPAIRF